MERMEEITKEKRASGIWSPLQGDYGEYFAIHGNYIAGAQANRLNVWHEGEKIFEAYSPVACNGYPVWKDDSVFWIDSRIDIKNGRQSRLSKLEEIFSEEIGLAGTSERTKRQRPVTFAWSPDARLFLVTMEGFTDEGISHSQAVLLDNEGVFKSMLWEGNDFAPNAACIGKKWIILGTRAAAIFDLDGNLLARLPGELLPQRIHLSEDELVLFIQTYETIVLWDTVTWSMKGMVRGPWLNATLSPDALTICAIDFWGSLYTSDISGTIAAMKKIDVSDPLATIDAGAEYIVASFAKGDAVRWTLRRRLDGSFI